MAIMIFNACGGGDTNWGIDGQGITANLPSCSSDPRDSSVALKVSAGSKILAQEEGTKVRTWHYRNTDKLICVISGTAKIEGK